MALIEINWRPDNRQLRQFAAICFVAFPLLAWLWRAEPVIVGWAAAVGGAIFAVSLLFPSAIKPLYLALTLVTAPIGMLVSELAMLAVFFGILLPIGCVFRILRRDALQLKMNRQAESHWRKRPPQRDAASYYRQY